MERNFGIFIIIIIFHQIQGSRVTQGRKLLIEAVIEESKQPNVVLCQKYAWADGLDTETSLGGIKEPLGEEGNKGHLRVS